MTSITEPTAIDYQEWLGDPHGVMARHRAEHWWAPFEGSDISEVLEYHAVKELLGDDAHMQSFLGGLIERQMRANPVFDEAYIEEVSANSRNALINMEGDEHRSLRALVSRAFTPRSVATLRPYLEELANKLAAKLEPGDDFMEKFARLYPAHALCKLTGIPDEDHERFAGWIETLSVQLSGPRLAGLGAEEAAHVRDTGRQLKAYAADLIAQRRANPQDDLISRLVHDADGHQADGVVIQLITDLIFAGNDTTRNALGRMVMELAKCPHAWEAVARDPSLAANTVEEVLRMFGPTIGPIRQACAAFEYRDKTYEAGNISGLSTWSANRDEAFWGPNANAFDHTRENAGQHLTFGYGAHFCLGASLAREEMRAALIALANQLTALAVIGDPPMHPVDGIHGPIELRMGFRRR